MTDNIIEKAKALFEQHKETPCFYFTSDGQAFQLFERAEHNASRLKDKTITELYNPAMSEAEITDYKNGVTAQAKEGILASFKRANPELSRLIEENAAKNGPQK